MDAFEKRERKKTDWNRAVKYCSCSSKDVTKPVKLFNMPLLKLASLFVFHRCIKAFVVSSMSFCVLLMFFGC